jgi:hypothetical protein
MKRFLRTLGLAILLGAVACKADSGDEGPLNPDPASNPTVTGVVPATAAVGDVVTLFGSNFGNDPSRVTVTFGSVHDGQVLFVAPTNMEVRIPAGASGLLQIVVIVSGRAAIGPSIVVI